MTRAPLARLVLALAIAGAAVPTLGVGPAYACSCAGGSEAANFQEAGAVFTGTLINREEPRAGESVQTSTYPAIYTFAVDGVYKGTITNPQRIVSYIGGEACGLELRGDGPFVVFTSRRDADTVMGDEFGSEYSELPAAFLCSGTREVKAGEKLPFGRGREPVQATPIPVVDEVTDTLGPTTDEADNGGPGAGVGVGVGAAALALIAGGFFLRRQGRS